MGAHNALTSYYGLSNRRASRLIDDDLERVEGVEAEVILSSEEFAALNDYLGY